jgi:hypothetical protein
MRFIGLDSKILCAQVDKVRAFSDISSVDDFVVSRFESEWLQGTPLPSRLSDVRVLLVFLAALSLTLSLLGPRIYAEPAKDKSLLGFMLSTLWHQVLSKVFFVCEWAVFGGLWFCLLWIFDATFGFVPASIRPWGSYI